MHTVDEAERIFATIASDARSNIANITTEEDTKIQIINRIINECLGWPLTDFRTERFHENGYSDYILVDSEKPALLIEAKRIGLISIDTAEREKVRYLKISGSALKGALAGIEQAASYSLPNGIPLSVLTDGITWIFFKTHIQSENYKNKEAIVFPCLEAVQNDFSLFYDLLAREQFRKRLYNTTFDLIHNNRLQITETLFAPIAESDIGLSAKTEIAFDLDKIFTKFFSRLSGENDDDLLIECFVETRESRIADFALEKMTRSVLGNINPLERDLDKQLANLIESNVQDDETAAETGQTIFIVGPTGAGKSTFLERFFHKTLPLNVRQKCLLASINCLDATGHEGTVLEWLTDSLIAVLEKGIYENGAPTWDDLQGLYHSEYVRKANGVDAHLYKRDKQAFKEKFGEYLDKKVEEDREGYLKRILLDIVKNRKLLPVLVIDNTDEFSPQFKEKVFQFSQALRRHANHCLVIFPVTDKSAWSFSKTDIFGIYLSKSFFLPTPSPREVFRKRIDFIKGKIAAEPQEKRDKHSYFSSKGISISIESLSGFAEVLENIFVDHDYTSKTIGELTNYNIRRTLALSQRVMTSPVIRIEDLIKSYLSGAFVVTDFSRFIEALVRGDYDAYRQSDHPEVFPVFGIYPTIRHSPLLKLRLLAFLESVYDSGQGIENKHASVESVVSYFDSIGESEIAIERNLYELLEGGLIEPYDTSNRSISTGQKLSITFRGSAHLRLAANNSTWFYQMALTTPIANSDVAAIIRGTYSSNLDHESKVASILGHFSGYLIAEDQRYFNISIDAPQYRCQTELLDRIRAFSSSKESPRNELAAVHGSEFREGLVASEVIATIDSYDHHKGFGFAESEGMSSGVLVRAERLREIGLQTIRDGDSILCDIFRGPKGLYVQKIHDVQTNSDNLEPVMCSIVRIFPDRGYGFVKLKESGQTAFFHVKVFPVESRSNLFESQSLLAEIGPDRKGNGLKVMRVVADTVS